MFRRKRGLDAPGDEVGVSRTHARGWGPFSGRKLTVIVCVAIIAAVAIPTAAIAAIGTFSNGTAAPAVMGTNSSAAAGAVGVLGTNTGSGLNTRYGVLGSANGTAGVGVQGTGTKYGVFSNGPLGVASGKFLTCVSLTGCVGAGALVSNAVTNPKLANGSVTSTKLASGSVGERVGGWFGDASVLAAGSVSLAALDSSAKQLQPLTSGETESGTVGGSDNYTNGLGLWAMLTFQRPVLGALTVRFGVSANCPGLGTAGTPGFVCIYDRFTQDVADNLGNPVFVGSTNWGAYVEWIEQGGGFAFAVAGWTVTAP